ncbi:MAG: hypothetical protein H0Z34_17425 [Brevibacillus sp.]|nr:hypothetical protein [Brevibacillus sp.]
MTKKLYEIAHCRAGDKGDTLILSLFPYDERDFSLLCEKVTAEKVKHHMQGIVRGEVIRYLLPNVAALQFVCREALLGGVTTSLALDTHGKSLSYALLEMEIDT